MKNIFLGIALRMCNSFLMLSHIIIIVFTAAYLAGSMFSIRLLLLAIWAYPFLFVVQRKLLTLKHGVPMAPQSSSVQCDRYFVACSNKVQDISVKPSVKEMFLGRLFPRKYPQAHQKVLEWDREYIANLDKTHGKQIKFITKLEVGLELWIYMASFVGTYCFAKYIQLDSNMKLDIPLYSQWFMLATAFLICSTFLFFVMVADRRSVLKKNIKLYNNNKEKNNVWTNE